MTFGAMMKKVFGDWWRLYTRYFFLWTGARIFYLALFFLIAGLFLIVLVLPLFFLIQSEGLLFLRDFFEEAPKSTIVHVAGGAGIPFWFFLTYGLFVCVLVGPIFLYNYIGIARANIWYIRGEKKVLFLKEVFNMCSFWKYCKVLCCFLVIFLPICAIGYIVIATFGAFGFFSQWWAFNTSFADILRMLVVFILIFLVIEYIAYRLILSFFVILDDIHVWAWQAIRTSWNLTAKNSILIYSFLLFLWCVLWIFSVFKEGTQAYILYHPEIPDMWVYVIGTIAFLLFSDIFLTFFASIYTALSWEKEVQRQTVPISEDKTLDQPKNIDISEKISQTDILSKTETPTIPQTSKKSPKKKHKK